MNYLKQTLLSRRTNMRNFIMSLTRAALLVGLSFYTLVQSSKQYDTVYQSNSSMISLHKLDNANAENDSY